MRRRVVITGMGVVTPLGHSVGEMLAALLEGQSGVGPITLFNASRFPTQFAAEVKGFDLAKFVSGANRWANSGPNSQFALAAASQALADADLVENGRVDRTRCGVYVAAGEGIQDFPHLVTNIAQSASADRREVDAAAFTQGGLRDFVGAREFEQEPHTAPAHLAPCLPPLPTWPRTSTCKARPTTACPPAPPAARRWARLPS